MKKNSQKIKIFLNYLILISISLFVISCADTPSNEASKSPALDVIENEQPGEDEIAIDGDEEVIGDPDPEPRQPSGEPVFIPKFVLKTGTDYYLSDGEQANPWQSGTISRAGALTYSIENQLIQFDASADQVTASELGHIPTAIKSTPGGVYYCYTYDAETSYAMGGQYREYTEFFKDNIQIGDEWYYNAFSCESITSVGDNVFAKDEYGAYHIITGPTDNAAYVRDNGFYIHDIDTDYNTIGFNGITETFNFNYILGAKQWIKHGSEYYSENGYMWSEADGLRENETALQIWNSFPYPVEPANPFAEAPVLLKAGSQDENLYWIECNSGWLFEYDTSTDELNQIWRMYLGSGLHSDGISKRNSLKPMISEGKLYFSDNGSVNRLDLETGFVDIFYAGDGEVMTWE